MTLHDVATEDTIVDISKTLEKFFGCSGKMLKPSLATVEAAVKQIPRHKLITTERLRRQLADRHDVDATCPFDTKIALRALANRPKTRLPYWRVLKANGELMAYYPGGVKGHAALLRKEGFAIDTKRKTPRVRRFKESLVG